MRSNALILILLAMASCKNNGNGSSPSAKKMEKNTPVVKEILVDAARKPQKPDFQVLEMKADGDVLTVVVRYSGGCETHNFNAYFNGGWLKSNPPQALLELEHLDPNNDHCRALVKDTVRFDLRPLQYSGSSEVVVKWMHDPGIQVHYRYGK